MKDFAYRFYSSKQWKHCRESYKKIMHYQCEMCGGVGEIVHHKIVLDAVNINDPNVALNYRNLRLLCRKCHGLMHGTQTTVEGVRFDDNGDLVAIPPPSGP